MAHVRVIFLSLIAYLNEQNNYKYILQDIVVRIKEKLKKILEFN